MAHIDDGPERLEHSYIVGFEAGVRYGIMYRGWYTDRKQKQEDAEKRVAELEAEVEKLESKVRKIKRKLKRGY